jgi:hypothetical protein
MARDYQRSRLRPLGLSAGNRGASEANSIFCTHQKPNTKKIKVRTDDVTPTKITRHQGGSIQRTSRPPPQKKCGDNTCRRRRAGSKKPFIWSELGFQWAGGNPAPEARRGQPTAASRGSATFAIFASTTAWQAATSTESSECTLAEVNECEKLEPMTRKRQSDRLG